LSVDPAGMPNNRPYLWAMEMVMVRIWPRAGTARFRYKPEIAFATAGHLGQPGGKASKRVKGRELSMTHNKNH